jgi:hypothetical protein
MKVDVKKTPITTVSKEFDRLLEDLDPDEKELMANTMNQLRNKL